MFIFVNDSLCFKGIQRALALSRSLLSSMDRLVRWPDSFKDPVKFPLWWTGDARHMQGGILLSERLWLQTKIYDDK